ncbi:hypothetical protein GLOTRDRAFT_126235 [Gloeophyllum trabeum ATCC 11539]|uniref:Transmembrane protein n=1 Tax=Gloeophyllum trabeum (strain ATCC 11539 / FP-39264 / Madison 617) TaxID=670483 RepID=S7QD01_GLOTA|nr:uncharacterized protein GLOTRDRAFT_126235 [Gloeophyllum trabeum ATCC 11539]EPQ57741.1 hypothetical protein GLOTRDRAFT_126235 [Gloeophyllum trabeum ATCC 11539]
MAPLSGDVSGRRPSREDGSNMTSDNRPEGPDNPHPATRKRSANEDTTDPVISKARKTKGLGANKSRASARVVPVPAEELSRAWDAAILKDRVEHANRAINPEFVPFEHEPTLSKARRRKALRASKAGHPALETPAEKDIAVTSALEAEVDGYSLSTADGEQFEIPNASIASLLRHHVSNDDSSTFSWWTNTSSWVAGHVRVCGANISKVFHSLSGRINTKKFSLAHSIEVIHTHPILVCVISTVAFATILILLGWTLRPHPLQNITHTPESGLSLEAQLASIDLDTGSMTIQWNVDVGFDSCRDYPNVTIGLYFDQNLLLPSSSTDSSSPTDNRPSAPAFSMNMTEACYRDPHGSSPFFRTDIAIQADPNATPEFYPLDKYFADIFLFTEIVNNSAVVPVNIARIAVIAAGYSTRITVKPGTSANANWLETRLTITRALSTRVFSLTFVATLWLVTLGLSAMSMAVLLRIAMMQAQVVLTVAAGTLFAFPALRSILPGAPAGSGAIIGEDCICNAYIFIGLPSSDFVGTLPCMILMTLCTITMIGVYGLRKSGSSTNYEPNLELQQPSS